MKKNLKLLIASLVIALTFALPQAIQGTELEPADESVFKVCPKEIKVMILHRAAIDECLNNRSPVNILLVCRKWRKLIEEESIAGKTVKKLCQEAWYGVPGHEENYESFLKGALIYRPQEGSDVGMIVLRIKDLENPLEGTFDLSQCGDTAKYLSISTGYRKGKKAENANKIEIWFSPRFLIKKKLMTTASHFQGIFPSWNDSAQVGMFWTWGGWATDDHDMDYLTSENMDNLSKIDLYENWKKSHTCTRMRYISCDDWHFGSAHVGLHVRFVN